MGWRNRPKYIDYWPDDVHSVMFIDENGDTSLKNIKKKLRENQPISSNEKMFTITGCVFSRDNFKQERTNITNLKNKYWEEGKFNYKNKKIKRVCFHSNEIRGKKGPFSPKEVLYDDFILDLSEFMEDLPINIFSATIDKEKHCMRYTDPYHPYSLCLDFVLERFVKYYLKHNEKGIIILEARGAKEDRYLLSHIKNTIDQGTNCVDAKYFKKIKGVYFNPKWCKKSNEQLSHFGLECADLLSYPIYKYCKFNTKDKAFEVLENKIYGHPNYHGYGFKRFPLK